MSSSTSSMSVVEFMLQPSRIDEHLEQLSLDTTLRPTATELVQVFLDLGGGTQAKRLELLLSLAAKVARKSGMTLEALEREVPMKHQLALLREMAKTDPPSRMAVCNVSRWMLRVQLRGDEGKGQIVTESYTEQSVQTLVALCEAGPAAECGGDEGGARSTAYLCAVSCDLGSWFFNVRKLQQAERWLRQSLSLFHKLGQGNETLCEVKEERLRALAIALHMLRVSFPQSSPNSKPLANGAGHLSEEDGVPSDTASNRPPLLMAAELLRLPENVNRLLKLLHIDNAMRLMSALAPRLKSSQDFPHLPWVYRAHLPDIHKMDPQLHQQLVDANLAAFLLGSPPSARSGPQQLGLRMGGGENCSSLLHALVMTISALEMCGKGREEVGGELDKILLDEHCADARACILDSLCSDAAKRTYKLVVKELEEAVSIVCSALRLDNPLTGAKRRRDDDGAFDEVLPGASDGGSRKGSTLASLIKGGGAGALKEKLVEGLEGLEADGDAMNMDVDDHWDEAGLKEAFVDLTEAARTRDAICAEDCVRRVVAIGQLGAPESQQVLLASLAHLHKGDLADVDTILRNMQESRAAAGGMGVDAAQEGEKAKEDSLENGVVHLRRGVLMLLCRQGPFEHQYACQQASMEQRLGLHRQAIKSYLIAALSLLTTNCETSITRIKAVILPTDLVDPLIKALCAASLPADAVLVSQMLETPQLIMCSRYCSEFTQAHCVYLWNLPCVEAITSALHFKGDARRVAWVIKAVERQQLNAFNAEHIRATFIHKLMTRFLSSLLRSFA